MEDDVSLIQLSGESNTSQHENAKTYSCSAQDGNDLYQAKVVDSDTTAHNLELPAIESIEERDELNPLSLSVEEMEESNDASRMFTPSPSQSSDDKACEGNESNVDIGDIIGTIDSSDSAHSTVGINRSSAVGFNEIKKNGGSNSEDNEGSDDDFVQDVVQLIHTEDSDQDKDSGNSDIERSTFISEQSFNNVNQPHINVSSRSESTFQSEELNLSKGNHNQSLCNESEKTVGNQVRENQNTSRTGDGNKSLDDCSQTVESGSRENSSDCCMMETGFTNCPEDTCEDIAGHGDVMSSRASDPNEIDKTIATSDDAPAECSEKTVEIHKIGSRDSNSDAPDDSSEDPVDETWSTDIPGYDAIMNSKPLNPEELYKNSPECQLAQRPEQKQEREDSSSKRISNECVSIDQVSSDEDRSRSCIEGVISDSEDDTEEFAHVQSLNSSETAPAISKQTSELNRKESKNKVEDSDSCGEDEEEEFAEDVSPRKIQELSANFSQQNSQDIVISSEDINSLEKGLERDEVVRNKAVVRVHKADDVIAISDEEEPELTKKRSYQICKTCLVCDFMTMSKSLIADHSRAHTRGVHICNYCPEKMGFKTLTALRYHEDVHKKEGPTKLKVRGVSKKAGVVFRCSKCSYNASSAIDVGSHFLRVHRKYRCQICQTYLDTERQYKHHMLHAHVVTSSKPSTKPQVTAPLSEAEADTVSKEDDKGIMRLDTYMANSVFKSQLYKAEIAGENEICIEGFSSGLSIQKEEPAHSTIRDCKKILISMAKAMKKPLPQVEKDNDVEIIRVEDPRPQTNNSSSTSILPQLLSSTLSSSCTTVSDSPQEIPSQNSSPVTSATSAFRQPNIGQVTALPNNISHVIDSHDLQKIIMPNDSDAKLELKKAYVIRESGKHSQFLISVHPEQTIEHIISTLQAYVQDKMNDDPSPISQIKVINSDGDMSAYKYNPVHGKYHRQAPSPIIPLPLSDKAVIQDSAPKKQHQHTSAAPTMPVTVSNNAQPQIAIPHTSVQRNFLPHISAPHSTVTQTSSNPSLVKNFQAPPRLAPKPVQNVAIAPKPVQNVAIAPKQVQNVAVAPKQVQNVAVAPKQVQNVALPITSVMGTSSPNVYSFINRNQVSQATTLGNHQPIVQVVVRPLTSNIQAPKAAATSIAPVLVQTVSPRFSTSYQQQVYRTSSIASTAGNIIVAPNATVSSSCSTSTVLLSSDGKMMMSPNVTASTVQVAGSTTQASVLFNASKHTGITSNFAMPVSRPTISQAAISKSVHQSPVSQAASQFPAVTNLTSISPMHSGKSALPKNTAKNVDSSKIIRKTVPRLPADTLQPSTQMIQYAYQDAGVSTRKHTAMPMLKRKPGLSPTPSFTNDGLSNIKIARVSGSCDVASSSAITTAASITAASSTSTSTALVKNIMAQFVNAGTSDIHNPANRRAALIKIVQTPGEKGQSAKAQVLAMQPARQDVGEGLQNVRITNVTGGLGETVAVGAETSGSQSSVEGSNPVIPVLVERCSTPSAVNPVSSLIGNNPVIAALGDAYRNSSAIEKQFLTTCTQKRQGSVTVQNPVAIAPHPVNRRLSEDCQVNAATRAKLCQQQVVKTAPKKQLSSPISLGISTPTGPVVKAFHGLVGQQLSSSTVPVALQAYPFQNVVQVSSATEVVVTTASHLNSTTKLSTKWQGHKMLHTIPPSAATKPSQNVQTLLKLHDTGGPGSKGNDILAQSLQAARIGPPQKEKVGSKKVLPKISKDTGDRKSTESPISPCSSSGERYSCDRCNYNTNALHKYEQHLGAHVHGKYMCKVCKKAMIKSSDLTKHWHTHKLITRSGFLMCDSCTFTTSSKPALEDHMKRHYYIKHVEKLPSLSENELASYWSQHGFTYVRLKDYVPEIKNPSKKAMSEEVDLVGMFRPHLKKGRPPTISKEDKKKSASSPQPLARKAREGTITVTVTGKSPTVTNVHVEAKASRTSSKQEVCGICRALVPAEEFMIHMKAYHPAQAEKMSTQRELLPAHQMPRHISAETVKCWVCNVRVGRFSIKKHMSDCHGKGSLGVGVYKAKSSYKPPVKKQRKGLKWCKHCKKNVGKSWAASKNHRLSCKGLMQVYIETADDDTVVGRGEMDIDEEDESGTRKIVESEYEMEVRNKYEEETETAEETDDDEEEEERGEVVELREEVKEYSDAAEEGVEILGEVEQQEVMESVDEDLKFIIEKNVGHKEESDGEDSEEEFME